MRRVMCHATAALVAVAALLAGTATAREVPFLSGRVNDTAGIIPADARERIEGKLKQLEQATGTQVAVLTIDTLGGEALEDYSLKVAQTWKLGHKGVDDGALLLVARDDHKMRLEVGYGLEGRLPDALCRRILDNVLRPRFRAGDFAGGIEAGVDAIVGTLQGKDVVPASAPSAGPPVDLTFALVFGGFFLVVMTPFSVIALFAKGSMSWFLYLFLIPFWAAFPTAVLGPRSLVIVGAWIAGFPVFKYWLRSTHAGKTFLKAHPGWASFATASSHSSSGGGWSSGGGFSGGGGSFGGGGASSSW